MHNNDTHVLVGSGKATIGTPIGAHTLAQQIRDTPHGVRPSGRDGLEPVWGSRNGSRIRETARRRVYYPPLTRSMEGLSTHCRPPAIGYWHIVDENG